MGLGRLSNYVGLSRSRLVYTPAWIDGLKDLHEIGATATVEIWSRSTETREYIPATNNYAVTYTPIKTGVSARVQPVRNAVQKFTSTDGTWAAHVLFSLHYDQRFDIRPGMRLKVLTTTHNEVLENMFYTVKEVLDSDNSIEFTFIAEVDTELVNNG